MTECCLGLNKTYLYHFDYRSTFEQNPEWLHSNHFEEVPYVFGHLFKSGGYVLEASAADLQLSLIIMSYWTNFAKAG